MLSKEGFCKALRMIRDQESIDEQFSKALNLVGDGHFVLGTENKYLLALRDVLKEAVNDQYDSLSMMPPERVMPIRQALLSPWEEVPVAQAVGRICAAPSVSCPPAVPVVVSGERIRADAAAVFCYYGISSVYVVKER